MKQRCKCPFVFSFFNKNSFRIAATVGTSQSPRSIKQLCANMRGKIEPGHPDETKGRENDNDAYVFDDRPNNYLDLPRWPSDRYVYLETSTLQRSRGRAPDGRAITRSFGNDRRMFSANDTQVSTKRQREHRDW